MLLYLLLAMREGSVSGAGQAATRVSKAEKSKDERMNQRSRPQARLEEAERHASTSLHGYYLWLCKYLRTERQEESKNDCRVTSFRGPNSRWCTKTD